MRNAPRPTKIRAHGKGERLVLGGWLQGRHSYLWIGARVGDRDDLIGYIDGGTLYRLAKAVVRHYEHGKHIKPRRPK